MKWSPRSLARHRRRPVPHPSPDSAPTAGFSLIEIMVVMVIIGILAGIAVPASTALIANAKAKTALNDANQLKMAISSYYTDYRKYPTRDLTPDDGNRPQFSDHALMDILLPSDKEAQPGGMNPRRQSTASFNNARPMGGGRYRGGLIMDEHGGGELWDPYGNYFRVVMDTDYNNRIPSPDFASTSRFINQSVIVWSAGPDEEDTAGEDNIATWRP